MKVLDAEATRAALGYTALVAAIREVLARHRRGLAKAAPRGTLALPEDAVLLINPATDGEIAATKLVTVHPRNGAHGLPTIQGQMMIIEAATGRPLGVVDGGMVSARRTAAVSLLAAQHLAPVRDTAMLVYGRGRRRGRI